MFSSSGRLLTNIVFFLLNHLLATKRWLLLYFFKCLFFFFDHIVFKLTDILNKTIVCFYFLYLFIRFKTDLLLAEGATWGRCRTLLLWLWVLSGPRAQRGPFVGDALAEGEPEPAEPQSSASSGLYAHSAELFHDLINSPARFGSVCTSGALVNRRATWTEPRVKVRTGIQERLSLTCQPAGRFGSVRFGRVSRSGWQQPGELQVDEMRPCSLRSASLCCCSASPSSTRSVLTQPERLSVNPTETYSFHYYYYYFSNCFSFSFINTS